MIIIPSREEPVQEYSGAYRPVAMQVCRAGQASYSRNSNMNPRELVQFWVDAFNRKDADALAALYSVDAVNHQVAEQPVAGRSAIRQMFEDEFANAEMVCIVEQILQDGEWAILEWRDPLGLRGCGFFHIRESKIVFQRGYWDKLSFLRLHGKSLPAQ